DRYPNALSFYQPISGNLEANTVEYRHDLEVQDTFAPTQNLTLISGAGYRYEKVTSKQYYNGSIDANKLRIFGNINWNASKNWVLHSGAMFEQEEDYESLLSFKAAVNYMFSPVESLRFVYSRAGRTPDFHEQFADWTYRLSDMETTSPYADTTYYDSFKGPGNLEHQTINAFEVGYFAQRQLFSGTAEWDVRVFREELIDVIHHFPSIHAETVYTGNQINYTGVEWQASVIPSESTQLRISGALLDTDIHTTEGLEPQELLSLYAPSVHTLAWSQRWSDSLNSTMSLFVVEDGCKVESDLSGRDTQMLEIYAYHDRRFGEAKIRISLRGQYDFSDEVLTKNGEPYRNSTRIQAGIDVHF
ncbi:MAG: TonB-dependent receptor, partial [Thalassolituus sp.]